MTVQNNTTQPAAGPLVAVSLRDEEVTLGPVMPNDSGPLFLWLNDTEAARLDYAWRPMDANAFKGLLDNLGKDTSQVLFAIRKLLEPQIIGFVALKSLQMVHRSAELAVRIGSESDRGNGYGGRAVALALHYAWNTLNLHRVSLTVLAQNTRAIAAYRKAGFVEEGVMRRAVFIDGRWADLMIMAALRPDEPSLH